MARAFAANGDRVAIHHRDSAALAGKVHAALPGTGHTVVSGDVGDPEAVRAFVDAAADRSFLTEASWAAREGLIRRGGIPGSVKGLGWAARFLERHSDHTVMSFPPPFAIKLMKPFRRIGA